MITLTLCKADPIAVDEVEDVEIRITAKLPTQFRPGVIDGEFAEVGEELGPDRDTLYNIQATHLAEMLSAALPSGTMHRLVIRLLERKADSYRGPMRCVSAGRRRGSCRRRPNDRRR